MGNRLSSKKRVIPLNQPNLKIKNKYSINEKEIFIFDKKGFITLKSYEKLFKENLKLRTKLASIQNSNFECCICYEKDITLKRKTRCKHDICVNCFHIIVDKKCPLCRKLIK